MMSSRLLKLALRRRQAGAIFGGLNPDLIERFFPSYWPAKWTLKTLPPGHGYMGRGFASSSAFHSHPFGVEERANGDAGIYHLPSDIDLHRAPLLSGSRLRPGPTGFPIR